MSTCDKRWMPNRPKRIKFVRTVEGGETVLFACSRVSSAEDPGILGFVN